MAIKYRGKFEPKVMADLQSRDKVYTYEPFELNYTITSKYTPDLVLSSGVIVEIKGKLDQEDRRKMLAVIKDHPDKDIRMLFQKLNARVVGASKRKDGSYLTCGEWAARNGIKHAELVIPDAWFTYEPTEMEEEPFREQGDSI